MNTNCIVPLYYTIQMGPTRSRGLVHVVYNCEAGP